MIKLLKSKLFSMAGGHADSDIDIMKTQTGRNISFLIRHLKNHVLKAWINKGCKYPLSRETLLKCLEQNRISEADISAFMPIILKVHEIGPGDPAKVAEQLQPLTRAAILQILGLFEGMKKKECVGKIKDLCYKDSENPREKFSLAPSVLAATVKNHLPDLDGPEFTQMFSHFEFLKQMRAFLDLIRLPNDKDEAWKLFFEPKPQQDAPLHVKAFASETTHRCFTDFVHFLAHNHPTDIVSIISGVDIEHDPFLVENMMLKVQQHVHSLNYYKEIAAEIAKGMTTAQDVSHCRDGSDQELWAKSMAKLKVNASGANKSSPLHYSDIELLESLPASPAGDGVAQDVPHGAIEKLRQDRLEKLRGALHHRVCAKKNELLVVELDLQSRSPMHLSYRLKIRQLEEWGEILREEESCNSDIRNIAIERFVRYSKLLHSAEVRDQRNLEKQLKAKAEVPLTLGDYSSALKQLSGNSESPIFLSHESKEDLLIKTHQDQEPIQDPSLDHFGLPSPAVERKLPDRDLSVSQQVINGIRAKLTPNVTLPKLPKLGFSRRDIGNHLLQHANPSAFLQETNSESPLGAHEASFLTNFDDPLRQNATVMLLLLILFCFCYRKVKHWLRQVREATTVTKSTSIISANVSVSPLLVDMKERRKTKRWAQNDDSLRDQLV